MGHPRNEQPHLGHGSFSSPLLPRSGGEGSGVGGLSAHTTAGEPAETAPTPDPSPPRASARGGRGEEESALARTYYPCTALAKLAKNSSASFLAAPLISRCPSW